MFSPINTVPFIFQLDHPISQSILSNPEKVIDLDLDDFTLQEASMNGENWKEALYHNEYLRWLLTRV